MSKEKKGALPATCFEISSGGGRGPQPRQARKTPRPSAGHSSRTENGGPGFGTRNSAR